MRRAQNRAQVRFVNALRFKGLGWIQLLPTLSATSLMGPASAVAPCPVPVRKVLHAKTAIADCVVM